MTVGWTNQPFLKQSSIPSRAHLLIPSDITQVVNRFSTEWVITLEHKEENSEYFLRHLHDPLQYNLAHSAFPPPQTQPWSPTRTF